VALGICGVGPKESHSHKHYSDKNMDSVTIYIRRSLGGTYKSEKLSEELVFAMVVRWALRKQGLELSPDAYVAARLHKIATQQLLTESQRDKSQVQSPGVS
jgi:hypothetical protein